MTKWTRRALLAATACGALLATGCDVRSYCDWQYYKGAKACLIPV